MLRFAVVRPYDDRFRARVFAFLTGLGFAPPPPSQVCAVGTPDDEAAAFVEALDPFPDLLLVPFHQHKDPSGRIIDGIGVIQRLSAELIARKVPFLMPVTDFAFASSFPRRMRELEETRPEAATLVVEMLPRDIGSRSVVERLGLVSPRLAELKA